MFGKRNGWPKALFFVLASWGCALASTSSLLGRWKTFDDISGRPKSIVTIYSDSNEVKIRVDSIIPAPGQIPVMFCKGCSGEHKDQPVIGLIVGWGLKSKGNTLEKGQILDPETGKIYRCQISMDKKGTFLIVRGYIGISSIGRAQKWEKFNP